MKSLVGRLLRRNISAGQLAGYALANLVGLTIVVCAVQFYRDVSRSFDSASDAFINRDYLVVSPTVSAVNTFTGGASGFSADDIADLQAQPWLRRLGRFTNADFNVSASVDFGGRSMQTFLFFESIPDEFFDVSPSGWRFDPEHPEIPIILSKDYLALYNFGFAASRGLPQLSEGVIGRVPLRISVAGNGRIDTFPGRIVGFSSRFNTIAVPQEFMTWANNRYGSPGEGHDPSRLILEVDNPGAPEVKAYLDDHGYEVAGDKADSSRAGYFLSVVTGIVVAVGVIISALAFFILVLSLSLLLQKNRRKLTDLMLLGYRPSEVARAYLPIVGCINAAVLVVAVALLTWGAAIWQTRLAGASVAATPLWPSVLVALGLMAVVTAGGFMAVRLTIGRYFTPSRRRPGRRRRQDRV